MLYKKLLPSARGFREGGGWELIVPDAVSEIG